MAKFINPFTDVGFKRIFGQDVSKPLLIDFLNNLLEREHKIVDLHFLDKEQVAEYEDDRTLIYDVYCEAENGEKFIVEMQNKRQATFVDRSIFYLSAAIARQGRRGDDWIYKLTPVYLIAFLNFTESALTPMLRSEAVFTDQTGRTVSDKAHLIYLQLPYFQKKEVEECENDFERWIYILKNMETLQRLPKALQSSVFNRLAEIADVASLSREERVQYDYALKKYRDTLSIWTTMQNELEEAVLNSKFESARKMKELGLPAETIMDVTGLTAEQISDL